MSTAAELPGLRIDHRLDDADERVLALDVLDGLTRPFKELPPKHFYDARGSELFEQICACPEYYPTRTERALLETHATELTAGFGELAELGSGAAEKALVLLAPMHGRGPARYLPIDVSESAVRGAAQELLGALPGLQIDAVIGDFERHLGDLPPAEAPRLIAFLGGTIGNFPPGSRRQLLRRIARALGPADRLLIGTDLVKDPLVIEAAYNDAAGVTAEFNRNVLHVINRELGADFVPEAFTHVAFFDRRHEWIEMRLRATRPCRVWIEALELAVEFAAGEEVRTEISAKFTRRRLAADCAATGLELERWLPAAEDRFALSVARRAQ